MALCKAFGKGIFLTVTTAVTIYLHFILSLAYAELPSDYGIDQIKTLEEARVRLFQLEAEGKISHKDRMEYLRQLHDKLRAPAVKKLFETPPREGAPIPNDLPVPTGTDPGSGEGRGANSDLDYTCKTPECFDRVRTNARRMGYTVVDNDRYGLKIVEHDLQLWRDPPKEEMRLTGPAGTVADDGLAQALNPESARASIPKDPLKPAENPRIGGPLEAVVQNIKKGKEGLSKPPEEWGRDLNKPSDKWSEGYRREQTLLAMAKDTERSMRQTGICQGTLCDDLEALRREKIPVREGLEKLGCKDFQEAQTKMQNWMREAFQKGLEQTEQEIGELSRRISTEKDPSTLRSLIEQSRDAQARLARVVKGVEAHPELMKEVAGVESVDSFRSTQYARIRDLGEKIKAAENSLSKPNQAITQKGENPPKSGQPQESVPKPGQTAEDIPKPTQTEESAARPGQIRDKTPKPGQVSENAPQPGHTENGVPINEHATDKDPHSTRKVIITLTAAEFAKCLAKGHSAKDCVIETVQNFLSGLKLELEVKAVTFAIEVVAPEYGVVATMLAEGAMAYGGLAIALVGTSIEVYQATLETYRMAVAFKQEMEAKDRLRAQQEKYANDFLHKLGEEEATITNIGNEINRLSNDIDEELNALTATRDRLHETLQSATDLQRNHAARLETLLRQLAKASESCHEIEGLVASVERKLEQVEKNEGLVETRLKSAQKMASDCKDHQAILAGNRVYQEAKQLAQEVKQVVESLALDRASLGRALSELKPNLGRANVNTGTFGTGQRINSDFDRAAEPVKGIPAPAQDALAEAQQTVADLEQYANDLNTKLAEMESGDRELPGKIQRMNELVKQKKTQALQKLEAFSAAFPPEVLALVADRLESVKRDYQAIEGIPDSLWRDRWSELRQRDASLKADARYFMQDLRDAKNKLERGMRQVSNCRDGGGDYLGASERLIDRIDTAKTIADLAVSKLGRGYEEMRATCISKLLGSTPNGAKTPGATTAVVNRSIKPAHLIKFGPKDNPKDVRWMLYGSPPDKDGWIHFGDGYGGWYHYPAQDMGVFRDEQSLCAVLRGYQVYSVSYPGYFGTVSCPKDGPIQAAAPSVPVVGSAAVARDTGGPAQPPALIPGPPNTQVSSTRGKLSYQTTDTTGGVKPAPAASPDPRNTPVITKGGSSPYPAAGNTGGPKPAPVISPDPRNTPATNRGGNTSYQSTDNARNVRQEEERRRQLAEERRRQEEQRRRDAEAARLRQQPPNFDDLNQVSGRNNQPIVGNNNSNRSNAAEIRRQEQQRQQAEQDRIRREEEARKRQAEEIRRRDEEQRRRAEQERIRREEETRRKQAEEMKRRAEEQRRRAEQEKIRREEEKRRQREAEEARQKQEEQRRRDAEANRSRRRP